MELKNILLVLLWCISITGRVGSIHFKTKIHDSLTLSLNITSTLGPNVNASEKADPFVGNEDGATGEQIPRLSKMEESMEAMKVAIGPVAAHLATILAAVLASSLSPILKPFLLGFVVPICDHLKHKEFSQGTTFDSMDGLSNKLDLDDDDFTTVENDDPLGLGPQPPISLKFREVPVTEFPTVVADAFKKLLKIRKAIKKTLKEEFNDPNVVEVHDPLLPE